MIVYAEEEEEIHYAEMIAFQLVMFNFAFLAHTICTSITLNTILLFWPQIPEW